MKVPIWQVVLYTVFVLALPTYLPDLYWGAYLAAYVVLFGLWALTLSDLRRRWRSFLRRYTPEQKH